MKFTSIIKRIDNLGRIVLPKDVRRKLKLKENDEVEIVVGEDGFIELKKYSAIDEYKDECITLVNLLEELIDKEVIVTDNSSIYICGKKEDLNCIDIPLSKKYIEILEERKVFNEKTMPTFNILEEGNELYAKSIVPIIVESSVVGSVAIVSKNKQLNIKDKDIELLKFAALILSNKMQN